MLDTFEHAIDKVKGAALIGILDDIGQLAETLREQIRDSRICSRLLPLLSKKWNEIDDNSNHIFPLFETFEAVVQALGPVIEPYAIGIYQRCCRILTNYVVKAK
jgi:transportin-1